MSRFKTSDWLKIGGAAAFLISFFFKWFGIDLGIADYSENGSDYFITGWIPLILIVGSGVLAFLALQGTKVGKISLPVVGLLATALGTLLVLLRLIFGREEQGVDLDRRFGLFLAVIAALVALAGWFLAFRESGGDLKDLTDANKLKRSFNTGTGSSSRSTPPPPPPPPGSTPPPPPPPTV